MVFDNVWYALDLLCKQFSGFMSFMNTPMISSTSVLFPNIPGISNYATPLFVFTGGFIALMSVSLVFRFIRLVNILA